MKWIIAGSRTLKNPVYYLALDGFIKSLDIVITEEVSGGAAGMDLHGETWAIENNVPVTKFPAEWAEYGRAAGPIRNQKMAEYADGLILVWDGKSKGSASMLKIAKKLGLVIHEKILTHLKITGPSVYA